MTENDNNENFDGENGPKALREALASQKKIAEEALKELKTLKEENRTRTVTDALKNSGLPEKVAKFVPTDASTPEAVNAWLAENGEVFGYKPQAAEEQQVFVPEEVDNSELARQFAEFQATTQQATNVQSLGQADPRAAALDKAGKEGGADGIAAFLRANGLVG